MTHQSVLKREVIECLDPQPNENFIDATVGFGGHAKAILEKTAPKGRVLGIEVSKELHQKLKAQNIKRLILVNDSYVNLQDIVDRANFGPISGILFDLGMSSWHLEKSGRGFSFQKSEPLDMRYDTSQSLQAVEIVNTWPEKEIEKALREFSEERFAGRIARNIVEARKQQPIKTTFQLVEVIKQAIPKKFHHGKLHPATRTFQALRIIVNKELENIKETLPQALHILLEGKQAFSKGRIVVISFHSGEDRLVKNFFKHGAQKGHLKILTKKPITASLREVEQNPRARSAKLRAAEIS